MWQLVFSFSNPLTTYVSFGSEIYALTAIYEFHTSVLGAEKLVLLPYIYIYMYNKKNCLHLRCQAKTIGAVFTFVGSFLLFPSNKYRGVLCLLLVVSVSCMIQYL
jgi:hypothetical protein